MNILLINPSQEKVYGKKIMPVYPPLGLLYVGTVLKNEGHCVRLVDIDTEGINEGKFRKIFNAFNPEAVGITSVTPTFSNAVKWGELSKKLNKDVPVIFGGAHASIAPEEVMKKTCVDAVVAGEGEITVKELFDALSNKRPDLKGIKGVYYKREGKIVANDKRPLVDDLDSIPFPDRSLLKKPRAFMPPDAMRSPIATILTSRGCPGDCTFCCAVRIFSKRFRARTVANMMREIEHLVRHEGVKEIHILDDLFIANKQRVLELSRELKKKGISVYFQLLNGVRTDFTNRDVLKILKDMGVKAIGYGVESGNEDILKKARKYIPLHITRNAFKLSKELGFETWAFLIFGLPGETEETIKETIKFTKELDPDFAKFQILIPISGTEVSTQLAKDNLILSDNYDDYGFFTKPVHRLPGLEPEKMLYWQRRAFKEFYLRPRKIVSYIRSIKSWQRFKMLISNGMFAVFLMLKMDKK